jgi:hypothetical protein
MDMIGKLTRNQVITILVTLRKLRYKFTLSDENESKVNINDIKSNTYLEFNPTQYGSNKLEVVFGCGPHPLINLLSVMEDNLGLRYKDFERHLANISESDVMTIVNEFHNEYYKLKENKPKKVRWGQKWRREQVLGKV